MEASSRWGAVVIAVRERFVVRASAVREEVMWRCKSTWPLVTLS